jgi:hypothetical protein
MQQPQERRGRLQESANGEFKVRSELAADIINYTALITMSILLNSKSFMFTRHRHVLMVANH